MEAPAVTTVASTDAPSGLLPTAINDVAPLPAEEPLLGGQSDGTAAAPPPRASEAWSISFGPTKKAKGAGKKERDAILASRLQGGRSKSIGTNSDAEGTAAPSGAATPLLGTTPPAVGEDGGVTGTTRATVTDVDGLSYIDLSIAIPRNLPTTRQDMEQRNFLDHQQMLCMVRQYKASCGVSSLTSVWNRLYSVIGSGSLPPVSQEEVMSILGFEPPFETIRWGPFTGNATLMRWFHVLNKHFGVRGKASYLYKVHGYGRTMHVRSAEEGKAKLYEAIKNPNAGVIYHCLNHYMVPMGFIDSPRSQLDVYAPTLSDPESFIMIGEVSRGKHPPMHIKKWEDVATDLNCSSPNFFNIRATELGLQTRDKCKTVGKNIHCLMVFRSDEVEEDVEAFMSTCVGEGGDDADEA